MGQMSRSLKKKGLIPRNNHVKYQNSALIVQKLLERFKFFKNGSNSKVKATG